MGLRGILRRRRPSRERPSPRDLPRRLIERYAPGRSFLDVGCMWKIHGGYSFHAAACGASRVVGVDVMAPTPEFQAENAARGNPVTFVRGDLNDPALRDQVGTADVVFCGGVLYHMPNPVLTLQRLRALSTGILILSSMTTTEQAAPQAAVFLPFLDQRSRARLAARGTARRIGLDTEFDPGVDYSNWFWLLTPSCIEAMLGLVGFEVEERHVFRRAACFVCAVSAEVKP